MKKIKLTIKERLGLNTLLNKIYQKGGLDLKGLMTAQKMIEKMATDKKERKKVDFQTTDAGTIKWDSSKDKGKTIELTADEVKMIKDSIKSKNKAKDFTMSDTFIVSLSEKVDLKLDK